MTNNLILASTKQNRLAPWKLGLVDILSTTLIIDKLDTLKDEVVRIKPEVLLLDFDLLSLNGLNGVAQLSRLTTETQVIVLSDSISEDLEWKLVMAGVRGCCQKDIKPEDIKLVVNAVQRGELWIRRSLACRLIDELGKITGKNKAYQASLSLLNHLTQREYDIAVRVGNGESNKQIAQSCAISERTVKAHLTEVYHKLGVTDRLNLALVLSANNGNGLANSDRLLSSNLAQPKPKQ